MKERQRLRKGELIEKMAKKTGSTIEEASNFYKAFIEGIEDIFIEGNDLTLTGFGSFYLQKHKGHKVQFKNIKIPDYYVFKFTASDVLNRKLRNSCL